MNISHNYCRFDEELLERKSTTEIEMSGEITPKCLDDVVLSELMYIPSPLFFSKPDYSD